MASYSFASSSILIDRGLRLIALRGFGSVRFVLLIFDPLIVRLTGGMDAPIPARVPKAFTVDYSIASAPYLTIRFELLREACLVDNYVAGQIVFARWR